MEMFEISWSSILKVSVSAGVLYIIAPFVLIIRDLCITKFIEKCVLTKTFRDSIFMCEMDRWYLDKKYSEPLIMDGSEYYIGKEKVTEEKYNQYEKQMWLHHERFESLDSKIVFRSNIINYAMNHYKNNTFINPIESLRISSYKHQEKIHHYN
ncbi:hypothetical protein A6E03_19700 [Aliivibrio sp. 1S128]|nr:hypothetical protein A6E03_19700 [Aliivibrio sp. 1S128]